jgi:methionyl-tRNA formyltransferase
MRIFIITMEDPLYSINFIKQIIDRYSKDIVGIAITKTNRLTIGKKKSKIGYIFSLLFIMGFLAYFQNIFRTLRFHLKKKLSPYFTFIENPSLEYYAKSFGIPVFKINSPNKIEFCDELQKLHVDLIINQCQSILKKSILDIPKIGVINRHNSLLPKNRGRLTPFWVLYNGEKETGVTIHFVEEKIDSGAIIVQEKFKVDPNETFNSLVKKNYSYAITAMLKALEILDNTDHSFMQNSDDEATYNTIPTFKQALIYRFCVRKTN